MNTWYHLYVVYRYDPDFPVHASITIKEILRSEDEAIREVDRLNALNGHKGCIYSFQSAKYYPKGREYSLHAEETSPDPRPQGCGSGRHSEADEG